MCGKDKSNRLKLVPLPNITIRRQIDELATDIQEQLISWVINSGKFVIQLDKITDAASEEQLMVYVRYRRETDTEEDLRMCHPLESTTKGDDVSQKVDDFFNEPEVRLAWEDCVGIVTDGASSVPAVHSGSLSYVKTKNSFL